MPEPIMKDPVDEMDQHFQEEAAIEALCRDDITKMEQCLNQDQRSAYDRIKTACEGNMLGAFFIKGPAGTGKTHLYNFLLSMVRVNHDVTGERHTAIAVAYSGVAALL